MHFAVAQQNSTLIELLLAVEMGLSAPGLGEMLQMLPLVPPLRLVQGLCAPPLALARAGQTAELPHAPP